MAAAAPPVPAFRVQAGVFLAFLVATWALVLGLGLDTLEPVLESHWQFLDLEGLRRAPLASLLHLHAQPPLLNAIAWLLMQLPGSLYGNFLVLNAACVALTATLSWTMLGAYLRPWALALPLACLYLVAPATLLNAAYPFYPCLTTAGYAVLVYAFFIARRRPALSLALFVAATLYLGLLRSSFSLLHAAFFCGLYYFWVRGLVARGRLLVALALVLLGSALVPLKNQWLYGFFGTSSWAPLNLAQGFGIPSTLGYFPAPQRLLAEHPGLVCRQSHGPQDAALTKRNGEPNYNACVLLEYADMVRAQIRAGYEPRRHARRIVMNSVQYLSPPDKYSFLSNREAIASYADAARWPYLATPTRHGEVRVLLLLVLAGAAAFALWRRDRFLGFSVLLVGVHFVSHVVTDGSEAQRFVFDLEFLFVVLLGAVLALGRARREVTQGAGYQ